MEHLRRRTGGNSGPPGKWDNGNREARHRQDTRWSGMKRDHWGLMGVIVETRG